MQIPQQFGQQLPPGAMPVTMPAMIIPLDGVSINVVESPEPDGVARIAIGPVAVQFVLDVPAAGATNIATKLRALAADIRVAT